MIKFIINHPVRGWYIGMTIDGDQKPCFSYRVTRASEQVVTFPTHAAAMLELGDINIPECVIWKYNGSEWIPF